MTPVALAEASVAIEGRLRDALTMAVDHATSDPAERQMLAGGIVTLLMRNYVKLAGHPNPMKWLEAAITGILAP